MLTKDIAICIRTVDYSETSQIVTFFTKKTGKISVIAKGSKRPKSPFDGTIELLSFGRIVFSNSSKEKLAVLTEFEQKQGLESLSRNFFAFNCSLFAAELVNLLTDEYDPHPVLFDGFFQFLQNIDKTHNSQNVPRGTLQLLIPFQLNLLREIGLQPILNHCINCNTKYETQITNHEFYFSSSANGLICRDCEVSFPDKIKLTKKAADCLNNLKLINEAEKKTLCEIEKVLIYHFTELLHKPPKMAKYIFTISS